MTREAAISDISSLMDYMKYEWTGSDVPEALETAIEALKQPEHKKAKWVFGTTMNRGWMKCSNCCVSQTPCGTFSYCPNCGAKMEVVEQ